MLDADALFALIDKTPALTVITDLEGNTLYMNAMARRMLGYNERPRIANHTIIENYAESAYEHILEHAIPTALRCGAWRGETVLVDAQGREIPVLQAIIFHPETDSGGELLTIAWDLS